MSRHFPSWPHYDDDEIAAVNDVLISGKVNYWTGTVGKEFEKAFATYHGCKYGIALANGTLALELALKTLGIASGDQVIVPCRTFIATASAVANCGAAPMVADVDLISQNITLESIKVVYTPDCKGIIVVHLGGRPCDMDSILAFAREKNIWVIEDCAQAHGAKYKGQSVGSFGDVAAFSCCQDKIISTGGEGGVLITNNQQHWQKAWALKDHGKNYAKVHCDQHPPGFRWVHDDFGSNYRLTEMQAAIGLKQLAKLDGWLLQRRAHAAHFNRRFIAVPGLQTTEPDDAYYHAYYKYTVMLVSEQLHSGWDRDRIMATLNAEGIPCTVGSCPGIHLEKAFKDNPQTGSFESAKQLASRSLMFPVHPTLSENDIDYIADRVQKVMEQAVNTEVNFVHNSGHTVHNQ